jgi:hypothetical protein
VLQARVEIHWFHVFVRRACVLRSTDTLHPQWGQPLAVHVKVHQREGGAQVIVVRLQTLEASFYESEDTLQYAERMFHLGSHSGLGRVLSPLYLIYSFSVSGAARGHVLGMRRDGANRLSLPLITSIAPHLALLTMQEIRQHMLVGNTGRS